MATYIDGRLERKSRAGLKDSSDDNTDVFEELLVNSTLLKLATQRGNIDCGGILVNSLWQLFSTRHVDT